MTRAQRRIVLPAALSSVRTGRLFARDVALERRHVRREPSPDEIREAGEECGRVPGVRREEQAGCGRASRGLRGGNGSADRGVVWGERTVPGTDLCVQRRNAPIGVAALARAR